MREKFMLIPWRQAAGLLTDEEVAKRCGIHPEMVKRLVVLGLIDPVESAPDLFFPEVTIRIQRVLRLRRDLGVNYSAAALILDLLDRIEELEQRLRRFESGE